MAKKKSMKPGGGGRFAALKAKVAKEPGVRDPAAVAADVGIKKYGAKAMGEMAHHEKPVDKLKRITGGK